MKDVKSNECAVDVRRGPPRVRAVVTFPLASAGHLFFHIMNEFSSTFVIHDVQLRLPEVG